MKNNCGKQNEPLILDVLILRNKGYSVAEIAKILGTTESKIVRILERRK